MPSHTFSAPNILYDSMHYPLTAGYKARTENNLRFVLEHFFSMVLYLLASLNRTILYYFCG